MYVKLVGLSYRTLLSTTPLPELSRVGLYFCYCVYYSVPEKCPPKKQDVREAYT